MPPPMTAISHASSRLIAEAPCATPDRPRLQRTAGWVLRIANASRSVRDKLSKGAIPNARGPFLLANSASLPFSRLLPSIGASSDSLPESVTERQAPGTVIATIDGQKVTYADVEKYLRGLPPQMQQSAMQNRKQFIQQYGLMLRG